MSYVAIYRALVRPTTAKRVIARGADYEVTLHPGPFTIHYQTAAVDPELPHAALDIKSESRPFPVGSYIVVYVLPRADPTVMGAGWNAAIDRFGQIVAALDLDFPGLVHEKLYEGTVATPAVPFIISPEGGLPFGERSYEPGAVAELLQSRVDHVTKLPVTDAARFLLASRWFRRANDSRNLIDRVLFYYMVLEVFPSVSGTDVPRDVSRFLHERVYANVSEEDLKRRLNLGPICGFRADIVHQGKASITNATEWVVVNDHVERLRGIARTCLRVLMGLDPGTDLDRFVLAGILPQP